MLAWIFTGIVEIVAQNVAPLQPPQVTTIRLVLTLVCVYYGITLILQTKDDFKFIIPYVEFNRELKGTRPLVLDTSALVDGRFEALLGTGLVDAPVVVPRFVLNELQSLADSAEKTKRAKGRRGLDAVKSIRAGGKAKVEIIERDPLAGAAGADAGVDRKLVLLGKELAGKIVTTDSALSKLASLDGVGVLNLHDISRALQAWTAVGDRLAVRLVKPGEGPEQAVGYLEDGAMVVVEKARERVGAEVTVEVTSGIRTSAGQMFFARVV
ncbi:MAG: PIN/TRAM domain-containing protein [Polyangiaceae bacterium]